MKSIESFDKTLRLDPHLNIHNEMLPYVGPNYSQTKILLISESHYVPKNVTVPSDDEWYNPENIDEILESVEWNTYTRDIFEKVFNKGSHPLFHNFKSALIEANSKINMENMAWYNFYQKPASNKVSIKPTPLDQEVANRVFEHILKTIDPELIVFASKKAFDSIYSNLNWDERKGMFKYKNFISEINVVPHANSAWWNRISSTYFDNLNNKERTGRQKFIDLIKNKI